MSGYRVEALESQLVLQAQESAHEIARLRSKVFEFEMDAFLRGSEDDGGGLTEEEGGGALDTAVGSSGPVPSGSAAQAVKALNAAAAAGVGAGAGAGAGAAGGGPEKEIKDGNPEETGGGGP